MPRKAGYKHTERTRDKIQCTQIINRLTEIGMGNVEATSPQVNALKALLNKKLPDLKAIEHSSDPENPLIDASQLSDAALAAIASRGS